jgi:hypothetical protein
MEIAMTGLILTQFQNVMREYEPCAVFVTQPGWDGSFPSPPQFSTRQAGYQIDEQELAEELSDALPADVSFQEAAEVSPDDFENLYQWFLS